MGVSRPIGIAAGLVGLLGASYLTVTYAASSNAWMREVPSVVPQAPVVQSAACGPVDESGTREPVHVEGSMPEGFIPATVVWCRADGDSKMKFSGSLVETTPWTGQWDTHLRAPDKVWLLAPIAEGPCQLVWFEPLYLLVLDDAGHGYRPHVPVDACEDSPELRAYVNSVAWEDA